MKIALVTGANRGLGSGFVEILSKQGYFVYAGMRQSEQSAFDERAIKSIKLDLQNEQDIAQTIQTIQEHHGHLDLLINNAGVNKDTATDGHKEPVCTLQALDRAAVLKMIDINALAPLLLTKHVVPIMTEPRAFIINISSERGSFSNLNHNANYGYRISKVALNMATLCTLHDLPPNIQTFAVHPGWVRTDMNPTGTLEPQAAAENIMNILDIWQPSMNGAFLNYDGQPYPL